MPMFDMDVLKERLDLKKELKECTEAVKVQEQKRRRLRKKAGNLSDADLAWLLKQKQRRMQGVATFYLGRSDRDIARPNRQWCSGCQIIDRGESG